MRGRLVRFGIVAGGLLAGGLAFIQLSAPAVAVQAVELDGQRVPPLGAAEVSPTPRLHVALSRQLAAHDWHIRLDGRTVSIPTAGGPARFLDLILPGPLGLGTSHRLRIETGSRPIDLAFRVVAPLQATVDMRFLPLAIHTVPTVRTRIHFSHPIFDQAAAQEHVRVTRGTSAYTWLDASTLEIVSSGLSLGTSEVVMLDAGIAAADHSFMGAFVSAGVAIPSTLTAVTPDRVVQMYYVNTPEAKASFLAHANQIDVLSPGWYDANADGSITGSARQAIIDAAHAHGVQIVPLVVNADVDPDVAHAILADPARRAALATRLVAEARTYGYAGFQLDFEQVRWTDRDLLTALVQDCARAFHSAGLSLSIAVIPRLPGDENATGAALDYYQAWSGAYDFPALARAADYLSVMTYDEHNGVTPPGPVSGIPWMRQALDYSLRDVPLGKAMLGLPTYYHDWTGVGYLTSSSYDDALTLAKRYGVTPAFDPTEDEMHFTYVTRWGVHHELWFESGDTLRQKLPLMYEYQLRGVSVWRLGFEDPAFWDLIVPRR
ncbi:MAG TPA: glycosyl hydrolase family 18 protein [Candidatus Eisenbacteria bacterium]|nr:glycosyl hydrolase family 18 protein [Candidatus Eisenbacteria bacterium]